MSTKTFERSGEAGAGHSTLQRAVAQPDLSREAREHLGRVDAIAADALRDLETISNEIVKLRDEITRRARMIGEATIRLDELQRNASQGYATIRNALDLVLKEFVAIPLPEPAREAGPKPTAASEP